MNTGQIRKSKSTERFTVIPNGVLENESLGLRAKGLLCWLLKLPPDWAVHKSTLHKQKGIRDGRDAVLAAFNELQEAGFITVETVREAGKFTGYNYTVYDVPVENPQAVQKRNRAGSELPEEPLTENPVTDEASPLPEKPLPGNPLTEKPVTENPALPNTESTKKSGKQNPSSPSSVTGVPEEGAPPAHLPAVPANPAADGPQPPGSGAPPSPGQLFPGAPEPPAKAGKKNDDPSKACHELMMTEYFNFHVRETGVRPKFEGREGGIQGAALKEIRRWLYSVGIDWAAGLQRQVTEDNLRAFTVEMWARILDAKNWERLEPFLKQQTKLNQISSNITNIFNQLKNGNPRKNGRVESAGQSDQSRNEIFDQIDAASD